VLSAVITDGVGLATIDLRRVDFKFAQVQIDDSASKVMTISNRSVSGIAR
jgi:hypothetical protein